MTPKRIKTALRDLVGTRQVQHAVIQLSGALDAESRRDLRRNGIELLAPLGGHAFFVAVDRHVRADVVSKLGAVRSVRSIDRNMRLHPMLVRGDVPGHAVVGVRVLDDGSTEPVVAAYAMFQKDVTVTQAIDLAERYEATVEARLQTVNGLVLELPLSGIHQLAEEDIVQWIEPALPRSVASGDDAERFGIRTEPDDVQTPLWNDNIRIDVQADTAQAAPYGLSGFGVEAMVYDVGIAWPTHSDFGGRVIAGDGGGWSSHATRVTGIIAGDGTLSTGLYAGMAPGVQIRSYSLGYDDAEGTLLYDNPGDLEGDYGHAINTYSCVIANNSIGPNTDMPGFPCETQGDYGIAHAIIDGIVPGGLGSAIHVVFAVGNQRASSNCDIEGFGEYYSLGIPASAKNHITVGAVNSNDNSMTSFSSWGPCSDGRLKPDLCAPGCQSNGDRTVTSTSWNGGYSGGCGTSMSCPTVVGSAALLLEDYRNQFPDRPDFRPATLKAMLTHNVLDLGQTGPDYRFGFGLVQIKNTIDHMRTGNFLEAEIDQGETFSFPVTVTAGTAKLQVTLAWDDVPGTPNIETALVNDLDLLAVGPGGTRYPWTLDPLSPATAAVQTGPDHLNNVEQVLVMNPAAGTWTIEVRGFDIPDGPQTFSVAATPGLTRTTISLDDGPPAGVEPETPEPFTVRISVVGEELVPGSAQLHFRFDSGPFSVAPLTPLSGELFEGVLPAVTCGESLEYYVSAEGSITGEVSAPRNAPSETYSPVVGTSIALFTDDLEINRGWSVGSVSDTASTGIWTRVEPNGTLAQPDADHTYDPWSMCFATGQGSPGGAIGDADVDGGFTTLTSPMIDLSEFPDARIGYWRWYSNGTGSEAGAGEDAFVVDISADGGVNWLNVETVGPSGPGSSGGWWHHEFAVSEILIPTSQVLLRFIATDEGEGSIVEAAIDDFTVTRQVCDGVGTPPADLDGDGTVGILDLMLLLASWGACGGCTADVTGDGIVAMDDLLAVLGAWN